MVIQRRLIFDRNGIHQSNYPLPMQELESFTGSFKKKWLISCVSAGPKDGPVMLRIDIQQGKKATSFILAGKVIGPWVTELEKCWEALTSAEPDKPVLPVLVDMTEVSFIDDKGKQLILRMHQSGARLTGAGLIAEFICREIEEAVCKLSKQ